MLYLKGTKVENTANGGVSYIRCVIAISPSNNEEIFSILGEEILLDDKCIYSFYRENIKVHSLLDGLDVKHIVSKNALILKMRDLVHEQGMTQWIETVSSVIHGSSYDNRYSRYL